MKLNVNPVIRGMIAANAIGLLLVAISKWIIDYTERNRLPDVGGIFVFSDFIIVPVLMGVTCAFFWRNSQLTGKQYTWNAVICGLYGILLSAIVLREGVICLIIVSPLIFGFIIGGVSIGRYLFKKKNNTLNVSFVSILFLFLVSDSLSVHTYDNMVADVVTIKASPEQVWKYVDAYEPIKEKPSFWLFRVGMPYPVQSTVDGHYKGAGRKCVFSNGYVFDEVMSVYDQNKELTFDITHQPRDPEIMGHIDILKGQFILKDNGDGTTTLTGNSWYRLYIAPVWYYDIWASSITRNVHLRVMEHIKYLAEHEQ